MRRNSLVARVVVAALLASAPATAFAHGGQYRGPTGEVPPDSRQPEDPPPPDTGPGGTPTPPDNPGGPTPTPPDGPTGTPTSPGTPGPGGGAPGGGSVPGPGGAGGGGTGTPRGGARKGPSFDSWQFWWNYNKDDLLGLRARMGADSANSAGAIGQLLGAGAGNESALRPMTARVVDDEVLPLLRACARDDSLHSDIQSASVLALARMGRREEIPLFMDMAGSGKRDRIVEESAALALGLLQAPLPEVRTFLGNLALDTTARTRTRCFAAVSLGLLGGRDAGPAGRLESWAVLRSLVTRREASRELPSSALVAAGLLGEPEAVPTLLGWLRDGRAGDRDLSDLEQAMVVGALGRIGLPGTVTEPRAVVDGIAAVLRKRDRLPRWSAAIALGQVAPGAADDVRRDAVGLLSEIVKGGARSGIDAPTVNFALISLGRIAGAPAGTETGAADPRRRAVETLLRIFGEEERHRPFAALGLGLGGAEGGAVDRVDTAERIRGEVSRERGDAEARGALVLALGMLRDRPSLRLLHGLASDTKAEVRLRGAALLAVGMIGDPVSKETVRRTLGDGENRELRLDAAVAAGLLRDGEAVPLLVAMVEDPKSSQFALGSASLALGRVGDSRAVASLGRVLGDGEALVLNRALAAVALGQLADERDLPVLARLSRDVNYRAQFDALAELLSIL